MDKLAADMHAFGNAATRTQLRELGWSHRSIRAAVDRGELVRLSRSWVGNSATAPEVVSALTLGGRVGGAAALRSFGVWVAEERHPVVSFPRHRNLPVIPADVVTCRGTGAADARHPWRVPAAEALAQYFARTTEPFAVAALDSALHHSVLLPEDRLRLESALPRRQRRWLRRADRRAEAGTETILRLACIDNGWNVKIQVDVPGGRVDFVVNGWLYIEVDGAEHHDVAAQAGKDRRRNNMLARMGMRWHRFSYADIIYDLERSMETIRILLRQGRPAPIPMAC